MTAHNMSTSEQIKEERIAEGCGRMLELFAAICGDPDNEDLAMQADGELAELDQLMTCGRG